jgi:hypothetical protein
MEWVIQPGKSDEPIPARRHESIYFFPHEVSGHASDECNKNGGCC